MVITNPSLTVVLRRCPLHRALYQWYCNTNGTMVHVYVLYHGSTMVHVYVLVSSILVHVYKYNIISKTT
jgi:hypothetical protein